MLRVLIIFGLTLLISLESVDGGPTERYDKLISEVDGDGADDIDDLDSDLVLDDSVTHLNPDTVNVGDMMLTRRQYKVLYGNDTSRRHGFNDAVSLWPNGIVPVIIDENAKFEESFLQLLEKAMEYISGVSCIKFDLSSDNPQHYLLISRGEACASEVGRQNGPERRGRRDQSMKVGEHCSVGNLVHEFLHVLGFLHMHTAEKRDDFVTINWNNIKKSTLRNFEKITAHVSMFDTQYDYRSIMHYSPKAFAVNNKVKTIVPKEPVGVMGQRRGMTEGDITRLNRMYSCPDWIEEEPDYDRIVEANQDQSRVMVQTVRETTAAPRSEKLVQQLKTSSNLSPLMMNLKSALSILESFLAPLFLVQEKISNVLTKSQDVEHLRRGWFH